MHRQAQNILLALSPIIFLICYVIFVPPTLRILGYFPNETGGPVAEKLVEQKRPPSDCEKIINILPEPFSPTVQEQRATCLYDYADLTHDIRACEFLLPSDYGWDCVGMIKGEIFPEACFFSEVTKDLYCNAEYSEGELTIKNPQLKNCAIYQRQDLRDWCHFKRTFNSDKVNECDAIQADFMKDRCQYSIALKKDNTDLCKLISDKKRRDFCVTHINLWLKYASSETENL